MNYIQVRFPGERAYCLPIGDIHFGDRAFANEGRAKLQGNLDWLREHQDEAFGVLMGDVFNVAGRDTKTSPFETDPNEIIAATRFFEPYASLFVGAIRGNHERRIVDRFGFDPMELFCERLKIPYLGISALIRVQVGKRPDSDWYWQSYYMGVHHTTGGGKTLGSAINAVAAIDKLIAGCDVYAGGHNHQLVTGVRQVYTPTPTGPKLQKVHYVSCGSYLDYANSYAEEALYAPSKLGSPRIRFSGLRDKHDVHVSL